jgi:serine/threonine-protein kinase
VPASAKAEGTKADSGKTDSAKVDAAAAKKQAKDTKTTAKPGTPETTSAGTAPRTTAANESASSQSNHATPATTPVNHGDPAKICEGKSFFSYQGCMTEQCAKPEFANAAICEQRRTQEQQNLKRLK